MLSIKNAYCSNRTLGFSCSRTTNRAAPHDRYLGVIGRCGLAVLLDFDFERHERISLMGERI